jgi:MATE family multidrug resistance protein
LGIAGAGWGISVSYWITLIILSIFIFVDKECHQYFRHIFTLEKTTYLWELSQIGLPMGVMYCVEVGFFFALALAMGVLGAEMQAANQVAMQYLGLMMSVIFALAQAITVRMGHLLGAGEINAAEKASYLGISIAVIFISFISVAYLLFPELLISVDFDVKNPENFSIVSEIKTLLAIAALFQILETIRIALFGALRSLKDTRFTMLASIISFWCIALPVGYLLAMRLQFGGAGFWWGMVVGAGASVILLHGRFKKKMKRYYRLVAEA